TFTAAVDGLIVTRATADGSWTGTEEVAIQIGSTTKKYTVSSGGSMSVAAGDTPFYWENKNDIAVSAWYPYNVGSKPDLEVKADQRGDGYQASDYLEATNATVTFQEPKLTFTHRTAKVVATLEAGDGITDLTGATLTFVNQGGVEGGGTEVTPKTETNGDNVTTHTALLIPQQIQNNQFIKVTIGSNAYYYTPANATDVDLKAGMAYTYTITVKKEGLQVTAGTSVSWEGGDETGIEGGTPSIIENYILTITDKDGLSGVDVKDADGNAISEETDGSYKIPVSATAFSVSYGMPSDRKKSLVPTSGLCRMNRAFDNSNSKYICNYSGIVSNVTLALADYVQMGDFYYSDGTWSAPFDLPQPQSTSPTVIGIVLKAGRDVSGNWRDDCQYKFKGTTADMTTVRGYVLALYDANGGSNCTWGPMNTKVDHTDMNREQKTGFYGYKNTQAIISFNKDKSSTLSTAFPATYYAAVDYDSKYAAPASSSGWFLPSAGQCQYWMTYKADLLVSVKKATGGSDYSWKSTYW
ncbi:fimbrillin family protein, partial [Parabacteroides sp.]